jgi:hypothetical protein
MRRMRHILDEMTPFTHGAVSTQVHHIPPKSPRTPAKAGNIHSPTPQKELGTSGNITVTAHGTAYKGSSNLMLQGVPRLGPSNLNIPVANSNSTPTARRAQESTAQHRMVVPHSTAQYRTHSLIRALLRGAPGRGGHCIPEGVVVVVAVHQNAVGAYVRVPLQHSGYAEAGDGRAVVSPFIIILIASRAGHCTATHTHTHIHKKWGEVVRGDGCQGCQSQPARTCGSLRNHWHGRKPCSEAAAGAAGTLREVILYGDGCRYGLGLGLLVACDDVGEGWGRGGGPGGIHFCCLVSTSHPPHQDCYVELHKGEGQWCAPLFPLPSPQAHAVYKS